MTYKKETTKGPISRRSLLQNVGIAGAAVLAAPMINKSSYSIFAGQVLDYSKRTIDLMGDAFVMDMLSLFDMAKFHFNAPSRYKDPLDFTRKELLAVKASGIDVFHPAIGLGNYEEAIIHMSRYNGLIAEHSDILARVDSATDLKELKKSGKIGIILGLQNSDHFRVVDDVKLFHQMGQRISQLTYNSQNRIASGSTDRIDGGISSYGEQIVKAMNKVGMAVDVSHCGDQTTLDAFELSKQPVLITHSNVRALTKGHPRCKTDEAIQKMAKSGGVMGITAVRNFVTATEPTTIESFVDHIDHVVKITGIEHVGIGTDADLKGYDALPSEAYKVLRGGYKKSYGFRDKLDIEGLDHPKKIFDLTEALIRRGYSDDNIRSILGGNFKRVLSKIWG